MELEKFNSLVEDKLMSIDEPQIRFGSTGLLPQMPGFNAVFKDKASKIGQDENSVNELKSTEELSLDNFSKDEEINISLDMEIEKNFSVSVQKKRKRLVELLETKR